MSTTEQKKIIAAPTPDIFATPVLHYRLLLELFNRTGGYNPPKMTMDEMASAIESLIVEVDVLTARVDELS